MFALDKNIVIAVDNHLFVISFTTGSETGLAVVTAPTERRAIDVLKHSGRYNGYPEAYKILESRNMGLTTSLRTELFLESYVNAAVVFDALSRIAPKEGPRGPEGPAGPSAYEVAVKNGFVGSETDWLISLKASITSGDITNILGYTPVSPAQLDGKVDKIGGMGLSQCNYTTSDSDTVNRAQRYFQNPPSQVPEPRPGDISEQDRWIDIPFDPTASSIPLDPPGFPVKIEYNTIGFIPQDTGWFIEWTETDEHGFIIYGASSLGSYIQEQDFHPGSVLYKSGPALEISRISYSVGPCDYHYINGEWRPVPVELGDLSQDANHKVVTDTQITSWNAKYEKPSDGIPASDLAADALPTGVYTIPITVTEGGWEVDPSVTYASVSEAISDGKILAIEPNGEGRVLADYEVRNGTINVFGSFCQMGVIGQLSVSLTDGETPEADFTSVAVPDSLSDLTDDNTHRTVTDTEKGAWDAKYTKPDTGIPASDLASGVIPDVSNFITKSVNDLTNYYLKSETYTQAEVNSLIGAISQFHYEIAASTSAVVSPASNVLYLIGPTGSGADKYEEYVYANNAWVKIGDTSIDLSGYVTTGALNTALAAYTTTADLTTLLSGKQDTISDLATIRSGAASGATAYQKPSTGIPASDLASDVIPDVPVQDVTMDGTSLLSSGGEAVLPVKQLATTTVPNVTSVGSASTWSFSVDNNHVLTISGSNGTTPTLGTAKTVATGGVTNSGTGAIVVGKTYTPPEPTL